MISSLLKISAAPHLHGKRKGAAALRYLFKLTAANAAPLRTQQQGGAADTS